MSFYRTMLVTMAAITLSAPVLADEVANVIQPVSKANPTVQLSDNTAKSATLSPLSQPGANAEVSKININDATAKELSKVRGLNTSKAKSIVSYRKKNGKFTDLSDLSKVKGFKRVKPEALKAIQDQLSL